jgi:hypothetical protein
MEGGHDIRVLVNHESVSQVQISSEPMRIVCARSLNDNKLLLLLLHITIKAICLRYEK